MSFPENKYLVGEKIARELADASMIRDVALKTYGLSGWKGAEISSEFTEIYDLNGSLLFYEFRVVKTKGVVGRIWVCASKVFGHLVFSSSVGATKYNFESAKEYTKKIVAKKYKDAEIAWMKIVCYNYPKLGIMAQIVSSKTKKPIDILVVDAAEYQEVEKEKEMWSMYGQIPQKERVDRIEQWETELTMQERIKKLAGEVNAVILSKIPYETTAKIANFLWSGSKILPVTTHGQQHSDWCAVATGQMLLEFYNYFYQQDPIAVAMTTVPQPVDIPTHVHGTTCGTTNDGQMIGYESLSRNYLEAIFDGAPTWQKAKDEIDANRPMKSSVRYPTTSHARACSGYQWIRFLNVGSGIVILFSHRLWINDPWPPDANNTFCNPQGGNESWEEWDSITHTNFIYLYPCTGTMVCSE